MEREIHKITAIVLQDNTIFMVRKVGKDIWTTLGGRPEANETEEETLLREINEEIHCDAEILQKLGDFRAKAAFDDAIVKLSVYLVRLKDEISLDDPELEECMFVPADYKKKGIKLPVSMEEQIIPHLIEKGLLQW